MHRVQYLRIRRLHDVADSLHAESDHGRGMAQRLASRDGATRIREGYVFDRRRRPDWSGMRPNIGTTGLFGSYRGSPRTMGRPCDAGSSPARLGVVDQSEGLPDESTAEDE